MNALFRRKPLTDLQEEGARSNLRRTLGAWDLTALGIGAIIGAGIFATVGTAAAGDPARPGAGPAIVLSFLLTAAVCLFLAAGLPWITWVRFAAWLVVGVVFFLAYGHRHSTLAK